MPQTRRQQLDTTPPQMITRQKCQGNINAVPNDKERENDKKKEKKEDKPCQLCKMRNKLNDKIPCPNARAILLTDSLCPTCNGGCTCDFCKHIKKGGFWNKWLEFLKIIETKLKSFSSSRCDVDVKSDHELAKVVVPMAKSDDELAKVVVPMRDNPLFVEEEKENSEPSPEALCVKDVTDQGNEGGQAVLPMHQGEEDAD